MFIMYFLLKFLYLRIWAENIVLNDYILHLGHFFRTDISISINSKVWGTLTPGSKLPQSLPAQGDILGNVGVTPASLPALVPLTHLLEMFFPSLPGN